MASSSSSLAISSRLPTATPFSNQQRSRLPFSVASLPPTARANPSIILAKSSSSSIQFFQHEFGVGLVTKGKNSRGSFCQTAAVRELTGSVLSAEGFKFAIVVARFNEIVTRPLLQGALNTFKGYSVKEEDIDALFPDDLQKEIKYSKDVLLGKVFWVPGCFEISLVAERLGKSQKYQAIICIGAVVRGDTTHYEAVANAAASGVMTAGLNSGVPCIFGVLTTENMDQALNRAGGKVGNKGSEAALTAIEMASLIKHHL